VWFSYNVKWWAHVGKITLDLRYQFPELAAKQCIQFFTFGQHNHYDLGNNYRPLLRIMRSDAPLYPDAIRIPSWRQTHGDKRADPRGRVPGDVFEFPRVTGNSHQRRSWHKTQLNEGLVERCIKLTSLPGDRVLDPFAGTGTTLRVCERLQRHCTLLEISPTYCENIAGENGLTPAYTGMWFNEA
jgi:DNA modification methylase